MQIWRLAKAGKIPGRRRSKGGQFYFTDCGALQEWAGLIRLHKRELHHRKAVADMRQRIRQAGAVKLPNSLPPDKLVSWIKSQPDTYLSPDVRAYWREKLRPLVEYYDESLGCPGELTR